eukprot:scaffold10051_cov33-Tisochrysis_lutea.AAC.2
MLRSSLASTPSCRSRRLPLPRLLPSGEEDTEPHARRHAGPSLLTSSAHCTSSLLRKARLLTSSSEEPLVLGHRTSFELAARLCRASCAPASASES